MRIRIKLIPETIIIVYSMSVKKVTPKIEFVFYIKKYNVNNLCKKNISACIAISVSIVNININGELNTFFHDLLLYCT